MTNEEIDSSEDEDFSWSEYLRKNNAVPSPASNFCQSPTPPQNEFQKGQKLEAYDPRNTSSTCLATVIEIAGPRIRLRLDGTDDRNDFWLMCDSDLVHPFEYSARLGRKISPPLGFGNELSKWPKFLERIINTAQEKHLFAPENCFRQPPPRPTRNEFRQGQKLEAVDPKNPHLICPATIKEVNRDKLLIAFDGWSSSSMFWVTYSSRDLFPAGWCRRSGHLLQPPGNLEEKQNPAQASVSFKRMSSSNLLPAAAKKKSATKKPSKSDLLNKSALDTSTSSSSHLNITMDTTMNEEQKHTKNQVDTSNAVDLSLVKTEALDYDDETERLHRQQVQNQSGASGKLNETTNIVKTQNGPAAAAKTAFQHPSQHVIVYVNPDAECGPFIKTVKFHKSHTKFGPGTPMGIYKSIMQSFVDCALNRFDVFNMVPEGGSSQFIKLITTDYNQRKQIIQVNCETEMWAYLQEFCSSLSLDCKILFLTKPVTNRVDKVVAKISVLPPTPQQSSSSSASSTHSSGSSEMNHHTNKTNEYSQQQHGKDGRQNKRRLSEHDNSNYASQNSTNSCKLNRTDSANSLILNGSAPITEWNIEQVACYISKMSDNYFSSFADTFRHHEIDGKALLLLTTEILMKYMGFKLGPALKLNNYLEKLRQPIQQDTLAKPEAATYY